MCPGRRIELRVGRHRLYIGGVLQYVVQCLHKDHCTPNLCGAWVPATSEVLQLVIYLSNTFLI